RWCPSSTVGAAFGALFLGCATQPSGGHLVKKDYRPAVIVEYQAEGEFPPAVRYFLVRTPSGPAFLEREADGSGTLFDSHWRDPDGDHFAVWVNGASAFEIFVPLAQGQPAFRFAYPARLYTVEKRG